MNHHIVNTDILVQAINHKISPIIKNYIIILIISCVMHLDVGSLFRIFYHVSNSFCPSLTVISKTLGISQNIAVSFNHLQYDAITYDDLATSHHDCSFNLNITTLDRDTLFVEKHAYSQGSPNEHSHKWTTVLATAFTKPCLNSHTNSVFTHSHERTFQ